MKPTDIEGKTRTLAEDQPEYMPLPIRDEPIQDTGQNVMFSAWAPDAEELERLNNGGRILLGIYGHTHPPVFLTAVGPLPKGPDTRPENCRDRLKEEGKPYPRSRCFACGAGLGGRPDCAHKA